MNNSPVIAVNNLKKRFNLEAGFFAPLGRYVQAVNGISFSVGRNETYGLVGESGCGKTTTARLLVRMYEADEGEINFRDENGNMKNARRLKGGDLKLYRERIKYVFQDPARSLNPRMTVYEILTSGTKWSTANRFSLNKSASDKSGANRAGNFFSKKPARLLREEAAAILEETGLSAGDLDRRPAEFSGGQRQRISIARGLFMKPDLLICDEVVSALDVSIQGQILNLLLDLRKRRESSGEDISFLFIAHDLKVASYFCDRIGVMYRGEIMEEAPAAQLWKNALHPYTELLFSSAAGSRKDARPLGTETKGAAAVPSNSGCAFAFRCPYAQKICQREKPPVKKAGDSHLLKCWRAPQTENAPAQYRYSTTQL